MPRDRPAAPRPVAPHGERPVTTKHGAEHTAHDRVDLARVRIVLERHTGPERAATEQQLAREAGMAERKFRACLADYDGIAFLVGKVNRSKKSEGGIFLARSQDEAQALTAEIASKAETMGNRLGRRIAYAEEQQARRVEQLNLFGSKVA